MEKLKLFHSELETEITQIRKDKYNYEVIFQQLIAANKELIAKCEDKDYDSDSDYEKEKIDKANNIFLEKKFNDEEDKIKLVKSLPSSLLLTSNLNYLTNTELKWFNGEKKIVNDKKDNELFTFSTLNFLQRKFIIVLKIIKCQPDTTCVGLSSKLIKDRSSYLGTEKELVEWAVMGNGTIFEEGTFSFNKGLTFKEGDIITIKFYNGYVTYYVNQEKAKYSYYFRKRKFYLAATLYFKDDEIDIIN